MLLSYLELQLFKGHWRTRDSLGEDERDHKFNYHKTASKYLVLQDHNCTT